MITSEETDQFWPAFIEAQALVEKAEKDSTNPHLRNRYTSLASVMDAIDKAVRGKFAITSWLQSAFLEGDVTEAGKNLFEVYLQVTHISGQWIRVRSPMPMESLTPHGAGGALTYGRRYLLGSIFHVAAEDDDGNTAMGWGKEPAGREPAKKATGKPSAPQQAAERLKAVIPPTPPPEMSDTERVAYQVKLNQAMADIENHFQANGRTMANLFAILSEKFGRPIKSLTNLTDEQILTLHERMKEKAHESA